MNGQDLGSAIKEIERLATAANKTSVLPAPEGEPRGTYYLVGADGKAERVVAAPAWHAEKLATPAELKSFIDARVTAKPGTVFYDERRVVYVYDLADRRDAAACDLVRSVPFQWLQQASEKPPALCQQDFIRLLRITFRGCLEGSNLLPLVRNLKFTSAADGGANLQHGRESMGRSLVAAVQGTDAIPEDVALFVPVFENHPFRARVVCAVEVLVQEQAFRLTPYPLEIRLAMDESLKAIADLFDGENSVPAFRGQPS